ncbi:acetyl-CoA C-acyltransferase, partial [Acinetobacter baumannii]
RWGIRREDQDALALRSHHNLTAAYERGVFTDLMTAHLGLDRDNNLRSNLTAEQLAKLQPVFDRSASGTMTAGNSTPLTDGASCVLL